VQPRVQGNFRDDSFPWKFNKFVAVRKILSSEIDGFLKVSNTGAFTLPQDEVIFAINFVFHGNDSYRSNDILKAVPVSILD
jgi:hypothetical protein